MAVFDGKFTWFALPVHIMADKDNPNEGGVFSRFTKGEKALYPVLYWQCNAKRNSARLTNGFLREFTGLDRNALPQAIRALKDRRLIRATPLGGRRSEQHLFQVLDLDGEPMTGEALHSVKPQPQPAVGRAWGKVSWEEETEENTALASN
jgi:hypothetical protein